MKTVFDFVSENFFSDLVGRTVICHPECHRWFNMKYGIDKRHYPSSLASDQPRFTSRDEFTIAAVKKQMQCYGHTGIIYTQKEVLRNDRLQTIKLQVLLRLNHRDTGQMAIVPAQYFAFKKPSRFHRSMF